MSRCEESMEKSCSWSPILTCQSRLEIGSTVLCRKGNWKIHTIKQETVLCRSYFQHFKNGWNIHQYHGASDNYDKIAFARTGQISTSMLKRLMSEMTTNYTMRYKALGFHYKSSEITLNQKQ